MAYMNQQMRKRFSASSLLGIFVLLTCLSPHLTASSYGDTRFHFFGKNAIMLFMPKLPTGAAIFDGTANVQENNISFYFPDFFKHERALIFEGVASGNIILPLREEESIVEGDPSWRLVFGDNDILKGSIISRYANGELFIVPAPAGTEEEQTGGLSLPCGDYSMSVEFPDGGVSFLGKAKILPETSKQLLLCDNNLLGLFSRTENVPGFLGTRKGNQLVMILRDRSLVMLRGTIVSPGVVEGDILVLPSAMIDIYSFTGESAKGTWSLKLEQKRFSTPTADARFDMSADGLKKALAEMRLYLKDHSGIEFFWRYHFKRAVLSLCSNSGSKNFERFLAGWDTAESKNTLNAILSTEPEINLEERRATILQNEANRLFRGDFLNLIHRNGVWLINP